MSNKQLVEYINKRRGQNIEEQNVVNELLVAGWPASDISEALSITGGIPKKKLLVISVATVLFLVGVSFFAYQYLLKPRFEVLELSVSTEEAALYEEVLVKTSIKNLGLLSGEYNLQLSLDGKNIEDATVELGGKETKEVQFELMFTEDDEWGAHNIELGNKSQSFVVNEGLLPITAIGDTIVSEDTLFGTTLEITEIVVGEDTIGGIECWAIEVNIEPEITEDIGGGGFCADKKTLFPLVEVVAGLIESSSVIEVLDQSPIFPLMEEQTINIKETIDTTINFPGGPVEEKKIKIFRYHITNIEDVDTPIGKIKAFRIDVYEDGELTDTIWQAPKVKLNIIKAINYGSGDTNILKSFSF